MRGLANRTSGYSGRDLLSLVQGGYSRCSSLSLSPSSSSSPASPSSGGPCLGDFERARREGGVGKGRGGGEGEIPFVSWEDVGASLQVFFFLLVMFSFFFSLSLFRFLLSILGEKITRRIPIMAIIIPFFSSTLQPPLFKWRYPSLRPSLSLPFLSFPPFFFLTKNHREE